MLAIRAYLLVDYRVNAEATPDSIPPAHGTRPALWIVGLALLVLGVAGAAAVMTVRADFRTIDTAVLSSYVPPVQPELARDYSRMLHVGEDTVATRLTIFRQAALYVILGGYSGLLALLLDR